jgi:hypothetical protein
VLQLIRVPIPVGKPIQVLLFDAVTS